MIICKCGKSVETHRTLQSITKGKIISLCVDCFEKKAPNLIKGHGYIEVLNHSKDELLDHWCSYNGITGENKEELLSLIKPS